MATVMRLASQVEALVMTVSAKAARRVIAGRRSYRLRELADALDLLLDATFD
jgi:hypothetical protein